MKRSIEQAQEDLAKDLMRREGVSGVGIGAHKGRPCLKVYVSDPDPDRAIPGTYEGHPVVVVGGGPFRAQGAEEDES